MSPERAPINVILRGEQSGGRSPSWTMSSAPASLGRRTTTTSTRSSMCWKANSHFS